MQAENLRKALPPKQSQVDATLLAELQQLWQAVRGLSHDHLQLAALESQLAGQGLVAMLTAGVLVALFFAGACFGLLVFAVLVLIEQGFVASTAILLAVSCNLMLVLIFLSVIRYKSRDLRFSALLRSLQPRGSRRNSKGNG